MIKGWFFIAGGVFILLLVFYGIYDSFFKVHTGPVGAGEVPVSTYMSLSVAFLSAILCLLRGRYEIKKRGAEEANSNDG
ncbi:hypothetical protein [Jeotgalibacillus aurantiacus]|uniref:hypothetical protein n=1 Tax=Jeotgalibacillus aurantiacus TaxID=2763266 RepID=UPI001D0A32BF|nr:hypothetical protein [Jeotgalibacillus aurantiacus]